MGPPDQFPGLKGEKANGCMKDKANHARQVILTMMTMIMMITMTIMMTLMLTMNDEDVDGDDIKANHVQHLSPVLLWNPRHKQQSCA